MSVPVASIARWSAIGVGGVLGAGVLLAIGRAALASAGDAPGVDSNAPQAPEGAPREAGPSRLGRPVRGTAAWAQSGVGSAVRGVANVFGSGYDAPEAGSVTTPLEQATESWRALHEAMAIRGMPGLYASNPGTLEPSHVWALGQNIAAAMDLAHINGDWSAANEMFARLPMYHQDGAYTTDIGPTPAGGRFWDDNAWIGLDLMQAYTATRDRSYLDRALEIVPFIKAGMPDPDGGVLWEERSGRPSYNTCTNGPALEFLLRLHEATGREDLLAMARQIDTYMERHLRRDDGLYIDNVAKDDPTSRGTELYAYNQGTPIGADVLWFRITGDKSRLDHATHTADATLAWLATDDNLWKQPPVFNAIFFRNLMALDAVAPNPRYRQALQEYVDRGWRDARNPETGLFSEGGIGSYDKGPAGSQIDQAGWVQLQALLAMPTGAGRPDIA